MKTDKLIAALSVLVISLSSCDKAKIDEQYPSFDRSQLKPLIIDDGIQASSSVTVTMPSGEVVPFARISYGSYPGDIANGYGNRSMLLASDWMTINGREDFMTYAIGYDEPEGKIKSGDVIPLKYKNFMWVCGSVSSFSGDNSHNRPSGAVKIVLMTKEEVVLHIDNVLFYLADGKYTIDGFVSMRI